MYKVFCVTKCDKYSQKSQDDLKIPELKKITR